VASRVISVLTANALAQKLTSAALLATAGQSPFGCWNASNGASSSLVAVEPDGYEYSASSANEVGSIPHCAPQ
jgi:hypothetical protein